MNKSTQQASIENTMLPIATVLECRKLSKHYQLGPEKLEVLTSIDLSVKAGERIAIVGASGAGKSTLLNMLGGLDVPSSGEVTIGGKLINSLSEKQRGDLRNRYLGFVYQFHHLLGEFSALENVAMPLLIRGDKVSDITERAKAMLSSVGLANRLAHKPAELSGGERQRVAIARALVTEPACVLLDEPTGNLDHHTAESIHQLIEHLNQQLSISFIIVTHDMRLAKRMDRTLHLAGGQLIADDLYDRTSLDNALPADQLEPLSSNENNKESE
jgi:lipoprotein-releasing system ATP-binding protein